MWHLKYVAGLCRNISKQHFYWKTIHNSNFDSLPFEIIGLVLTPNNNNIKQICLHDNNNFLCFQLYI